eukprot:8090761-Lingulodinium_polyedra.AAC.1
MPGASLEEVLTRSGSWWARTFAIDRQEFKSEAALDLPLEAFFDTPGIVVSDRQPRLFQEVFEALPRATAESAPGSAGPKQLPTGQDFQELLQAHPWLRGYLPEASGRSSGSGTAGPGPKEVEAQEVVVEPQEVEAIWAALDVKRQEWQEEDKAEGDDFATRLRGGVWTSANKGTLADV